MPITPEETFMSWVREALESQKQKARQMDIPIDEPLSEGQMPSQTWNIERVQKMAELLRRPFKPAGDIKDRLELDLNAGALVFFTDADIEVAQRLGLLTNQEIQRGLLSLVRSNDIGVVPRGVIPTWSTPGYNKLFQFQDDFRQTLEGFGSQGNNPEVF